jgi:hypothetical protein
MSCCERIVETDGKNLEEELNGSGPGEAVFVKCDVTIEADIKVSNAISG